MTTALDLDLEKLNARAFDRADWAEKALQRYHSVIEKLDAVVAQQLSGLYRWMFVPPTLWPFNVQDVLEDCLAALEQGKRLNSRHGLLIELLPDPPDETICAGVAAHELHVQKGNYENLVKTQAKYAQNELAIRTDPELRRQWARIKAAFDVQTYRDHKGVIRRTMTVERNLRPSFSVNMRRRDEIFHAVFDAFCMRWNLYGMQHDEPLPLKFTVNLTPHGTMIHIPAYWSFDPACGSGGMFDSSARFVFEHKKNPSAEFSIHGVEQTDETGRLCGLDGEIKNGGDINSHYDDRRRKRETLPERWESPNNAAPHNRN